jgi:short-subunit dehydrogenase involved in D-alanine esterification of teichoic acids
MGRPRCPHHRRVRGIGLAAAERFLAAGASVMVTGRSEEALAAAVAQPLTAV